MISFLDADLLWYHLAAHDEAAILWDSDLPLARSNRAEQWQGGSIETKRAWV